LRFWFAVILQRLWGQRKSLSVSEPTLQCGTTHRGDLKSKKPRTMPGLDDDESRVGADQYFATTGPPNL
jgi:hypothetical protein